MKKLKEGLFIFIAGIIFIALGSLVSNLIYKSVIGCQEDLVAKQNK